MKELKITSTGAEVVRAVVFGLEDSLVSTLGVLTGLAAAAQTRATIILAGLVLITVEAISVASSEYLSSKVQKELELSGIEKLKKKIKESPGGVIKQLVGVYRSRGLKDHELVTIVSRLRKNPKELLEELIAHQLHLPFPLPQKPLKSGLYMGIAYFLAGFLPLFPYFVMPLSPSGGFTLSTPLLSVTLSFLFLFYLGHFKGKMVGRDPVKGGLEVVGVAAIASLAGFLAGRVLASLGLSLQDIL